jgi:hypothetical protein
MEEKTLYRISNPSAFNSEDMYVRLSESSVDFLTWLYDNDFLSEDIRFNVVDDVPKVAEF